MGSLNPVWSQLIESIEKELTARTWTQAQLARRSGISRQQLNSYMNGGTEPGLDKVGMIAKGLDLEPWELLRPEGRQATDQAKPPLSSGLTEIIELLTPLNEAQMAQILSVLVPLVEALRGFDRENHGKQAK